MATAGGGPDVTPYEANLNNIVQCKDCDRPTALFEESSSGDLVCSECGLVVGDRIVDTRSEWRTFANDEGGDDPSRVGDAGDPIWNDGSLETKIDTSRGQNASGRIIGRLNNANKKTQNDRGQAGLQASFAKISEHVDKLQGGKPVLDYARHLFKMVDDAKFLKGKSPEAVIAGCIFIACRANNVGRTFREIHALTSVSKKEIGRVYKSLEDFVKRNPEATKNGLNAHADEDAKGPTPAEELCIRYCASLGFKSTYTAEKISRRLAERSSSVADLAGRSPLSVAAACIYMASFLIADPKTTKEIAQTAGVSDGTIKTAYRFLLQAKDQLVDEAGWGLPKEGGIKNLPPN
ncbi:transcription initiation factor IIB [Gaeumannomyces tritici R3-111a-1]|uniref:Transcription initiation factor IIB n=1 Tax=Gaeumannomyces tritici (strain R3-111a-1) TaxID=644352 RepID=J3NVT5_GAET3|nr:transcription initiation factor IIB [Gaeumannomyces tritici R3-111a-1]EJT75464.1 transcription initiation factor IIB [Gaeumannomyces tritici R3-111a-1]